MTFPRKDEILRKRKNPPDSQEEKRSTKFSRPSKDIKETKNNDPFLTVLDNKILEYTEEENFVSTHYDPAEIPQKGSCYLSFFQNRLPVVTLLQHAVYGEYKAVDAMLTKNPLLLLEADTVVDYSGRKHVDRTVLQLALGAEDIDIQDDHGKIVVDGMIPMIKSHFQRLPNKKPKEIKAIMQKQYEGQYPKNYKNMEAKQDASDEKAFDAMMTVIKEANNDLCEHTNRLEYKIFILWHKEKSDLANQLKNIIQTIYKAENNETFTSAFDVLKDYLKEHELINKAEFDFFDFTVLEALYRFRNHWEPKKAYTTGKHFNHKILEKAFMEYITNYDTFGAERNHNKFDAPKNIFCWTKIIGYLERFVPASDAQVIAEGPFRIIINGNRSQRTLDWRLGFNNRGGGHYYPLGDDDILVLGYNCATYTGGLRGVWDLSGGKGILKFLSIKNASLNHYAIHDNPSLRNNCLIL